ncbi:uncharacterized protein M421DRAFT_74155 [Didymella exigua CBS 183.55]|uniref:Uncharacterized protein n=1 Tax=Didymella exigua CBS 183.55 TaxID=1150837 RepID=A0A6A5R9H3_9PLEO|nr:uncharacterized protein M421DRAFT_74155 [Didymella exigua CBS 183.55]KAF1923848.1 hypothetical protein M421DRAFT_74155 [Didymella exigua CBS 183.55]
MCKYWKKTHTCTHPSDRPYIEMCRPGFLTNTVCGDICDDPVLRRSHFPCWPCIKTLGRVDAEEKLRAEYLQVATAEKARELSAKARFEADKKGRDERVRRGAREKAERERAVEMKVRAEREREAERARREGGQWMLAEAGSGKKKKRGSGPGSPVSPSTVVGGRQDMRKENGSVGGNIAWKEDKSEVSGRAGIWGPKKILSRKEDASVPTNRVDSPIDTDGTKK